MSADTYYEAVRPDGASFHDPSFRWVPEDWTPADGPVRVEHTDYDPTGGAGGYLSVSTEPADCTSMRWPCRLLIVQPVGEVLTPEPLDFPHKRAGRAFDVIGERPAHEALGPNGREVAALLAELESFTSAAWDAVRDAVRDAARTAAWEAAWTAAWTAAWIAARDAVRDAAWTAAWEAAWDAAWDAAWIAAREAAWDAVLATLARDLITPEQYEALMTPVEAARAVMRATDSTTTPRSDR